MKKNKLYKDFFEAFVSFYSYYGLIDDIRMFRDFIFRCHENLKDKYVSIPEGFKFKDDIKEQLWCILVLLYGSYGIAPRWGWIEDVNGAIAFLDAFENLLEPKYEE